MAAIPYGYMHTVPTVTRTTGNGTMCGTVNIDEECRTPFNLTPCVGDEGQVQYQIGPKIPHSIKHVANTFGFDDETPIGSRVFIDGYYVIVALPSEQKPYYTVEPN